jgi:NADH-quinone oxidoreductase subunit N
MNAPFIWIILPLGAAALFLLGRSERWSALAGGGFMLFLSVMAAQLPVDTAIGFGSVAFRIDSSLAVLGRRLVISSADQPILVLLYGIAAFWFVGSLATNYAQRLVPFGMAITALLVASLAVEPFLFAALLIEMAVLISIPLLVVPHEVPGRGVIRFLIYQTLAMPFILFSGFLLSGVEASPGDLALVIQATSLLGLGFAFLLAVFPFYTWIPLLTEEAPPYAVGFILLMFSTAGLLMGLNFIDRYTWLRETPLLYDALRLAGILMLTTSGIWAAFQRHLGRLFGYAVIAETGVSLLSLSLSNRAINVELFFLLLFPRALALGIWALSISLVKEKASTLRFNAVRGLARTLPFAVVGIFLAQLSLDGLPLLAGFPIRQAIWEQLSRESLTIAFWFGIGTFGLLIGAIRTAAALVMAPSGKPWSPNETLLQQFLLGTGWAALFLFGIFPQWTQPLLVNLPIMFEHIGR